MTMYPPRPGLEYEATVGGLTEVVFGQIEARLKAEAPAVRYLKELDSPTLWNVHRYSLWVHREDRASANGIIRQVMDTIHPPLSRVEQRERDVATLLRQRMRAGEDRLAAELMRQRLAAELAWLCEAILRRANLDKKMHLWFDGTGTPDEALISPVEISIRGSIWAGRAGDGADDSNQAPHPIEAHLRSTPQGPFLDQCLVRIGDRPRLVEQGVMPAELSLEYTDDNHFAVRIGGAVRRVEGQTIEWGIEIEKMPTTP